MILTRALTRALRPHAAASSCPRRSADLGTNLIEVLVGMTLTGVLMTVMATSVSVLHRSDARAANRDQNTQQLAAAVDQIKRAIQNDVPVGTRGGGMPIMTQDMPAGCGSATMSTQGASRTSLTVWVDTGRPDGAPSLVRYFINPNRELVEQNYLMRPTDGAAILWEIGTAATGGWPTGTCRVLARDVFVPGVNDRQIFTFYGSSTGNTPVPMTGTNPGDPVYVTGTYRTEAIGISLTAQVAPGDGKERNVGTAQTFVVMPNVHNNAPSKQTFDVANPPTDPLPVPATPGISGPVYPGGLTLLTEPGTPPPPACAGTCGPI